MRLLRSPIMAVQVCTAVVSVGASTAVAQPYETRVVASSLNRPTGIAARGNHTIFFTEIPTPGIPGPMGGQNGVKRLSLPSGHIRTLNMGEPEPVNLAWTLDGSVYWTCKSAGVILERDVYGDIMPLLTGLHHPNGIGAQRSNGDIFFTQLPTPGVPGPIGGMNTVNRFDGDAVQQLTIGEPEPTDIAVTRDGTAYWTCRSAGVILRRTSNGTVCLLLSGLNKPTGIALNRSSSRLYFTEVPTPGVAGSMGGGNFVWEVELGTNARTIVNFGDPQPTDVTVSHRGRIYWTCTSAGVIVEARSRSRAEQPDDPEAADELAQILHIEQQERLADDQADGEKEAGAGTDPVRVEAIKSTP